MHFYGRPNLTVFALNTPPLPELGSSSGFDLRLQDRGNIGYKTLAAALTGYWPKADNIRY